MPPGKHPRKKSKSFGPESSEGNMLRVILVATSREKSFCLLGPPSLNIFLKSV